MSFPTALPAYTITSGGETPNTAAGGTGLSGLLNLFEVDITALAAKMGTGASTPVVNAVLVGSGTGTSAWVTTLAGLTLTTATLSSPTIANFTNATHNHTNAAGGGQLGTSALTNAAVTADKLSTGAARAVVATSETTTSTTYADLATTSDQVTVTIGANALAMVLISADLANNTANGFMYISFVVSGTSTVAVSDQNAAKIQAYAANAGMKIGISVLLTAADGLVAGSSTFKMKYKVATGGSGSGTGTALNRLISVIPL